MAEMGAGGEKETGAGSSGTEGRIAMNNEISLHRKTPAIFDSKTMFVLSDYKQIRKNKTETD